MHRLDDDILDKLILSDKDKSEQKEAAHNANQAKTTTEHSEDDQEVGILDDVLSQQSNNKTDPVPLLKNSDHKPKEEIKDNGKRVLPLYFGGGNKGNDKKQKEIKPTDIGKKRKKMESSSDESEAEYSSSGHDSDEEEQKQKPKRKPTKKAKQNDNNQLRLKRTNFRPTIDERWILIEKRVRRKPNQLDL